MDCPRYLSDLSIGYKKRWQNMSMEFEDNSYKASESQETNLPLTILSFIVVLER
jgi:hypothetical protein